MSLGFNVSIPISGTGGSFSLNTSQLKLLAEHEAVKRQSAIVACTGGYDINVNGHTHLAGAAVASKADAGLNSSLRTHTAEQVAAGYVGKCPKRSRVPRYRWQMGCWS